MIVNIFFLICMFEELESKKQKKYFSNKEKARDERNKSGRRGERRGGEGRGRIEKKEIMAMILLMFLFFVITSVFSVFETVCTPITSHYFSWDTKQNGFFFLHFFKKKIFNFNKKRLFLLAVGFISIITFLVLGFVVKKLKIDDRVLLFLGLILILASMLVVTPYPNEAFLRIWQFYICGFFMAVGFPIASSLSFSLFSKV